ncbi:MAG: GIY-YIG nuclease family protein [Cyanobacteria bacterium]|nr:GIY-YIG nuclease family protein [Cyanobacteriota bacterium]
MRSGSRCSGVAPSSEDPNEKRGQRFPAAPDRLLSQSSGAKGCRFESCWAHHSTHLRFAYGEPKVRSWRAICRSNALSERSESKGSLTACHLLSFRFALDDGIVVLCGSSILRCVDGSFYVGETSDLDQRIADHNRGRGGAYTAHRRPVCLAYAEKHSTRADCLGRERQVKGWTRAKKEALIEGD